MTTPSHNDSTKLSDWDFGDEPKPVTARDLFEGLAMHALITTPRPPFKNMTEDEVARLAILIANALLKAREQK
jgi:hypothetical protein